MTTEQDKQVPVIEKMISDVFWSAENDQVVGEPVSAISASPVCKQTEDGIEMFILQPFVLCMQFFGYVESAELS